MLWKGLLQDHFSIKGSSTFIKGILIPRITTLSTLLYFQNHGHNHRSKVENKNNSLNGLQCAEDFVQKLPEFPLIGINRWYSSGKLPFIFWQGTSDFDCLDKCPDCPCDLADENLARTSTLTVQIMSENHTCIEDNLQMIDSFLGVL